MTIAAHRFNNDLRYRAGDHPNQIQLTPLYALEPIREALGGAIDLDPCTEPDNPTGANRFYTPPQDGVELPWWDASSIFCNPPYGKARERWVQRCIEQGELGKRVALLIPANPDTRIFQKAMRSAHAVVFVKGRLKFGIPRDNGRQQAASHPSAIFTWNCDTGPLEVLGVVAFTTIDEAMGRAACAEFGHVPTFEACPRCHAETGQASHDSETA